MDNAIHAKKLKDRIDTITSPEDGWKKVILTAHSMGGLITKKYIAETDGDKVKFLFTMGTPYYGAVAPYKFLKEGDDFGIKKFGNSILELETIKSSDSCIRNSTN